MFVSDLTSTSVRSSSSSCSGCSTSPLKVIRNFVASRWWNGSFRLLPPRLHNIKCLRLLFYTWICLTRYLDNNIPSLTAPPLSICRSCCCHWLVPSGDWPSLSSPVAWTQGQGLLWINECGGKGKGNLNWLRDKCFENHRWRYGQGGSGTLA